MEGYKWKLNGFAKGVDVNLVVDELSKLQNLHGAITPDLVVKAARPKKSILHNLFEWDENKAAYNWRLQQARMLMNNIQVVIISDGQPREISVYEVTSRSEGYKSIDTFTSDDIQYVRETTVRQLNTMREKLKTYKELDGVIYYIGKAIEAAV